MLDLAWNALCGASWSDDLPSWTAMSPGNQIGRLIDGIYFDYLMDAVYVHFSNFQFKPKRHSYPNGSIDKL